MSHESTPAAERGIGRSPTHLEARDWCSSFFPPANKVLPLVVPSLRLPSDARLWRDYSVGGAAQPSLFPGGGKPSVPPTGFLRPTYSRAPRPPDLLAEINKRYKADEVLSRHRVLIESFMLGIKREGENQ